MLLYEQVRLRRSLHPGKLIRYCEAESLREHIRPTNPHL